MAVICNVNLSSRQMFNWAAMCRIEALYLKAMTTEVAVKSCSESHSIYRIDQHSSRRTIKTSWMSLTITRCLIASTLLKFRTLPMNASCDKSPSQNLQLASQESPPMMSVSTTSTYPRKAKDSHQTSVVKSGFRSQERKVFSMPHCSKKAVTISHYCKLSTKSIQLPTVTRLKWTCQGPSQMRPSLGIIRRGRLERTPWRRN